MSASAQHSRSILDLSGDEISRSAILIEKIARETGRFPRGEMPFSAFMNLALHDPELGYYASAENAIGIAGDFVTAPEIGDAFGKCLAHKIANSSSAFVDGGARIWEFGAGNGTLAVQILNQLKTLECPVTAYSIVEISPALKARQLQTIRQGASWASNLVTWQESLPDDMTGMVVANELLDALPVELFEYHEGTATQAYVGSSGGQLEIKFSSVLTEDFKRHFKHVKLPASAERYQSELHVQALAWLRTVAQRLKSGSILIIDYGFPAHEYYHLDRSGGTLVCHRRQHVIDDPLANVGCQDISAHVDFSAIANAAQEADLELNGFTTLAAFLLDAELLRQQPCIDDVESLTRFNNQVSLLTSPAEMGDLFKVMELTKGIGGDPVGFRIADHRHRL